MRSKKNAEKKGNVPEGLSCSKSFFLPKILPPECEMSKGLRLPNQEAKFIENAVDYELIVLARKLCSTFWNYFCFD